MVISCHSKNQFSTDPLLKPPHLVYKKVTMSSQKSIKAKKEFRIGELNPGLVGTDHLSTIESDKS
jgi:hypothetical protein